MVPTRGRVGWWTKTRKATKRATTTWSLTMRVSLTTRGSNGGGATAEVAAVHVVDDDVNLHPDDWL